MSSIVIRMMTHCLNIFSSGIYHSFVNNWIFICSRFKIFIILQSVFIIWKKSLDSQLIFFVYEGVSKLRPILGYNFYLLKRKNKRRIYKLRVFLLNRNTRNKKAIRWLIKGICLHSNNLGLQNKILAELYNLNFLQQGYSLKYKILYYQNLISNKTSRNFLW